MTKQDAIKLLESSQSDLSPETLKEVQAAIRQPAPVAETEEDWERSEQWESSEDNWDSSSC